MPIYPVVAVLVLVMPILEKLIRLHVMIAIEFKRKRINMPL